VVTKALPKRFLHVSLIIWLPILTLAFILLLPQVAYAGGEVTDCSDDVDLHNKLAGGGLVTFNCPSTPVTITLTASDPSNSHITITQTTTIDGGGLITLRGDGNKRIFNVDGSSLNLQGLRITRGRALIGPNPNDFGGAIRIINGGVVTVTDSTLFDNQAQFGGAIGVAAGSVTAINSSLFDNQALFGGAVYEADPTPSTPPTNTVTIVNSTITGNTATDGDGGAIRVWDSMLTVANSTLSNNRAVEIAGGFTGGDGGAVGVSGTEAGGYNLIAITNTTIYSNSASTNGGGVHIDSGTGSGLVKNSIIANNAATTGPNCTPNLNLVSNGHNLSSDNSCNFNASGDLKNTNPLLGPLADNGGGSLTRAPLPGSPVINAADNTACAAPPVNNVDQRGVSRPQGTACDIGAVEATADLHLIKSSASQEGDPVQPTERLTYTIVVTNTGSLTATNALISDTLPANTAFVTDSIRLSPSGAGTVGTGLPTLASELTITPNQPISVTFAVTINSPLPDQTVVTNTASVTSSETPGSVSDTVSDIVSAPSLTIHKSSQDANGGGLVPGDILTYTIMVSNSGTANAMGAHISDTLPANTAFVPGSIRLSPSDAGTPGTTPPTLASSLTITPNQPVSVTFAVTVNSPLPDQTPIANTASITSSEMPDPITGTITDTTINAPSLTIRKSSQDANGGQLVPGDTLTYTVAVANTGTLDATDALISDTLPANTAFVPGSIRLSPSDAGTPGTTPPTLASGLTITAGQSISVTFAVTVNSPLPDQTPIANTASVTSSETPGPVTGTVSDIVSSEPGLAIRKSSQDANGGQLVPGDVLTYTIAVTNSGTANATGALISDTLPANTAFVPGSIRLSPSDAGTPGTTPPTLASTMTIAAGQSISVTFAVTVNSPLPDQTLITNTASVTSNETPGPLSDIVSDVVSAPSLTIHKSSQDANGGDLVPGDVLSYTIVVTNSGTVDATGALISDTLPANTAFVPGSIRLSPSDAGTPGTTPPTLASNLTMTAGQSISVTFAVTVDSDLPDQTLIANTASVTSNETPGPLNDTVSDLVTEASSNIYLPLILKGVGP
jgi:uncharacterized repeat protein (TIGR01451 family)